ncbi:hypothetical protein COLO4_15068 [Corchorus olitorius]|uniref:F-box domain-containing protein n=1 Tax=Corchorus olitorius TaxID=93759 RepID=A0A1R3JPQ2_9ROSI|nr:hypothetical protein COLO4_15068 [Corchorus olitorius]
MLRRKLLGVEALQVETCDFRRKKLRDESEIDMVNWSNLPLDILEEIIGRLGSLDRISMRAVCKAWSVSNPRIPTIDNFPWALSGDRLIYPPLHKREVPLRREEFQMIRNARAHASSYGWLLFEVVEYKARGELGAFNLQLKEWTMLTLERLPDFDFQYARLIASDHGDFRLMGSRYLEDLKLLKFDFSEKRWVKEDSLNNRVLFVGATCFYCPAVGETSQLANHVFSCWYPSVRCYGTESDSLQYQNWAWTALRSRIWIEFPSTAIWSANDLMTAH